MALSADAHQQQGYIQVDLHNTSNVSYNGSYGNPNAVRYPVSCENATHFNSYFSCSGEFELISSIKLYSLPLFVVIGSIGNMLCFAVLTQKSVMQCSMSFYMAVLLVLHTVVLYMSCALEWYTFIVKEVSVLHKVDWLCRVFHFSFNVVRCAAWWLLVAMMVDSYLDMWCPIRAQYMCTVFNAKFATTSIFVWLISLHVHALWIYEVKDGMCRLDAARQDFETKVWPWITAIFSHYLPMFLVFVFVIILVAGCRSNRSQELTINQKRHSTLTIILGTLFICTALPTILLNLVDHSQPAWQNPTDRKYWPTHAQYIVWKVLFATLESSYITSCFLLFFAAIPPLRSELHSLLRTCKSCSSPNKRGPAQEMINTATTDRLIEESKTENRHNHSTSLV